MERPVELHVLRRKEKREKKKEEKGCRAGVMAVG